LFYLLLALFLNFSCVVIDWFLLAHHFGVIKYSEMAVLCRASILATEVEWLNSIKADLVVIDA
jgi:hypothetical protein